MRLYRFDQYKNNHTAPLRQLPKIVSITNFEKPIITPRFFKNVHKSNPVEFSFKNELKDTKDIAFSETSKSLRLNGIIDSDKMSVVRKSIDMFRNANGKCIVEIGTIRSPDSKYTDGWSTFYWARTGSTTYTIDIDENACKISRKLLEKYGNVKVVCEEGVLFLNNFNRPIDLLYLDGWNDPSDCQEKYYLAAKRNLHSKSIIIINGTGFKDLGRGKSLIPRLQEDGYLIKYSGLQYCFVGKND